MSTKTPEQRARVQRAGFYKPSTCTTNKYLEHPESYLRHKYHGMKQRCGRGRGYEKIEVRCSIDEFVNHFRNDPIFLALHTAWVDAGRVMGIAPSIDRIDSQGHYEFGNMQFLTNIENFKKGREANQARVRMKLQSQVKRCALCHRVLTFDLFSRKSNEPTGRHTRCKECVNNGGSMFIKFRLPKLLELAREGVFMGACNLWHWEHEIGEIIAMAEKGE